MQQFDGTTILCVRKGSQVALGGDGEQGGDAEGENQFLHV